MPGKLVQVSYGGVGTVQAAESCMYGSTGPDNVRGIMCQAHDTQLETKPCLWKGVDQIRVWPQMRIHIYIYIYR